MSIRCCWWCEKCSFCVRQNAEGNCFSSWTRYNHRFFSVDDGNFYATRKFEIGTKSAFEKLDVSGGSKCSGLTLVQPST